jgi:hypothetical protein
MREEANEKWERVRTSRTPGTRNKRLIRASMVLPCALSEARTNMLILLGGRPTPFGMPVALIF